MRDWIPISTSPRGRLALAAVREFGTRPYDTVTVGELAAAAGVTTGAIYHHFESKIGLYLVARQDVERRLLDRMEGAAAAPGAGEPAAVALLVGFDFAVAQGFTRLLGDPPPDRSADAVAHLLATLTASGPAMGRVLAASWRAAVVAVADGLPEPAVRAALTTLVPNPAQPDEATKPTP